jgi:hypothetical protein
MGAALSAAYLIVIAVFVLIVWVVGKEGSLSGAMDVSPGSTRSPSSPSRPAGRGGADQSRREAFARQMASLFLAALIVLWLVSCANMFW